jgi:hypothetical protein
VVYQDFYKRNSITTTKYTYTKEETDIYKTIVITILPEVVFPRNVSENKIIPKWRLIIALNLFDLINQHVCIHINRICCVIRS